MNINQFCVFVSSDKYDGSKLIDRIINLMKDNEISTRQCIVLTNLGDDIKFATKYPEIDFIICNKPESPNIELTDRFKSAKTFIEVNNIKDYILLLDD